MLKGLSDEKVWKEGSDRGLKRGIPIAIVDFMGLSLAGRVFKTGRVASRGRKVAAQVGERMAFDPAVEGIGELSAQVISGQKIDGKEIVLEIIHQQWLSICIWNIVISVILNLLIV